MHLTDITGWMVRRVLAAPVALEVLQVMFVAEELEGILVSATVQALVTMGEWVRDGSTKVVPGLGPHTVKEAGHVLRAG